MRLRAWLMPPAPMAAPGGYDFARAAWFQRIGATGRALDIELLEPVSTTNWRARISGWRERLAAHVRERQPGAGPRARGRVARHLGFDERLRAGSAIGGAGQAIDLPEYPPNGTEAARCNIG